MDVRSSARWWLVVTCAGTLSVAACAGPAPVGQPPATGAVTAGAAVGAAGDGLFAATPARRPDPVEPQIVRSRLVTVDLDRLLGPSGPTDTPSVVFNLFPDAVVEGTVDHVERAGDSVSWWGRLAGVEFGTFSMVHTAGVFMAHVAGPFGIYEVTNVDGDVYRVVQIDQTKFPGGRD